MRGKPTVISLFCGTGGSSLGYKWAGYKELLAIDFDSHAVECFKLNFPKVPCWKKSVLDVTGKEILKFCKIKKGELDVLDGSPPCQGFSTAGKRNVNDSRNDLFLEYWRLIQEMEPKVFIMENVPGMAEGKMKGQFIKIIKMLKSGNYRVSCKRMNAMWYGVPQSRERLIFIGIRKDLKIEPLFCYPIPTNRIITVESALRNVIPKNFVVCKGWALKAWNRCKIGKNLSTSNAGLCNKKSSGYGHNKINPKKPSPTMLKSPTFTKTGLMHWNEKRSMAINEMAVLCSFPENWLLGNDFSTAWARLGNAVMPKFMKAIALEVKKRILTSSKNFR